MYKINVSFTPITSIFSSNHHIFALPFEIPSWKSVVL